MHTAQQYGSFAGRGNGAHPVEPLTQARAAGAHTGGRYGPFTGRAETGRRITHARAHSAHTGARYGSFAGREVVGGPHPVGALTRPLAFGAFVGKRLQRGRTVGELTQARAFGPHTGRRYGVFSGRGAVEPPVALATKPPWMLLPEVAANQT